MLNLLGKGNVFRESYELVSGQGFYKCSNLRSLDESLQRVRQNRECSQALGTFVFVSDIRRVACPIFTMLMD
jgi:hypothetical protein